MSDLRKTRQWQNLRLRVLARDAWTCRIRADGCTITATTVDHIRAISDGGDMWNTRNLRAACVHCNMGRHQPRRGANWARRRYRTSIASYETRL